MCIRDSYNPILLHIGDSSNPQKATGIFFNENDLSVCLTLFTPLFFPLKNKGYKINVFYIIILSVIEFILLKNDSMICFFSLLVGIVLYAIFYGIKYKWIFVSLTYFYLLEKLIFFLSISRSTDVYKRQDLGELLTIRKRVPLEILQQHHFSQQNL